MSTNSFNSFLVIGDVHLEHVMLNKPELKQDLYDAFERSVDKAIELDVKYFITVGDLTDTSKPTAETIAFLTRQHDRLEQHSIAWLGLVGDHDKQIGESSWLHDILQVPQISSVSTFVGVDYNDDSKRVGDDIDLQLDDKRSVVEFLFFHGQIPELFGYCEEKKTIALDWELMCKLSPA